jgi:hypothetical protein
MITNIGYKLYIVFAVINFATIPVVYFCFLETSQRPLEMVDLLFEDREGKRPSIHRVVRDSVNKEFVAGMEARLQEDARARVENEGILDKETVGHLENASA